MRGPFGPFKLYVQKAKHTHKKIKSKCAVNARDKHMDTTNGAAGQKKKNKKNKNDDAKQ